MKMIVTGYVEDDRKVNPERFGDYIREMRTKYSKLLKTDKIGLLVIK